MKISFLALLALIGLGNSAGAAIPGILNIQGVLRDSTGQPVPDSAYDVSFGIYSDSTGGFPVWEDVRTITTQEGLFNALPGASFPVSYFDLLNLTNPAVAYLGIKPVGGSEILPRIRLATVPYALTATHADIVGTVQGATGGQLTGDLWVTGSLGIGTGSPTEALDVVGSARVSGRVTVETNAGPDSARPIGLLSRDNTIVAWGRVDPNGTLTGDYNVASVSHPSTGHYEITLDVSASDASSFIPVAQALGGGGFPHIASVVVITQNTFHVDIWWALSQAAADNAFTFIVTGR